MKTFWLAALCVLGAATAVAAPSPGATALYFVEQAPGEESGPTRMIVTSKHLRIDDGKDGKDFVLYDRADKTIYSVSSIDETVIVIRHQTGRPPAPYALKHQVDRDDSQTLPPVGGKPVMHYRLRTNGDLCYDVYAVEGLLPEALTALREFRESLAGEQGTTLAFTPKEMQTPCDLANNVYLPARHLAHGFPIRTAETTSVPGRVRMTELVDYKTDYVADAGLFQLPAGYRRLKIEELRAR